MVQTLPQTKQPALFYFYTNSIDFVKLKST